MTQINHLSTQPIQPASLGNRMLVGAGIALLIILAFVLGVNEPRPEWGKFWMLRPLIITPLAGSMGGAFFYSMNRLLPLSGWKKVLAVVVSILGYLFALWIGIILGLDGTLWD